MRPAKSLQHKDAPGETRTPNLLIRSQSLGSRFRASIGRIAQEAAKELPKPDSESHNNSHNAPDIYADSRVFLVWGWAV